MKTLALIICLISTLSLSAQKDTLALSEDGMPPMSYELRGKDRFRIMFYNVENLFDWEDDTAKRDESFTPEGDNHWHPGRFWDKQRKISQTIIAAGGWEAPEIVGVCEVENRFVLEQLVQKTALYKSNYQIVHEESDDSRGIDVALIYRPDKFELLHYHYIKIKFDEEDARPTRDILYVKGIANFADTIHVFVNHWPSRFGGHLATDPKRMKAATTLRSTVDSIFASVPSANIIITGDFNDHPEDKSIIEGLQAKHKQEDINQNTLFNLMHEKMHKEGTHKFQGEWGILDMWIVSDGLMNGTNKLEIAEDGATIFNAPWLLMDETVHLGKRPFRTYQGPKYIGGYSDHMPIILDLKVKK